jgi:uncharacterized protein (TIGR03663 family)
MQKTTVERKNFLDIPLLSLFKLDWEKAIYLLILVVAIVTRFWDLGARAMSHDESLHTLYAWKLYAGQGYQHNPMMHGPFLFHFNALIYFLFGDNDYTSRISTALFGVILVMLPYFMRRWLGRIGALLTSVMLLFSPSMLYYSRYIRHDIFVVVWLLILLIAFFRYLEERADRWLYLGVAATAFMFCVKEVAFIYGGIVGTFFVLLFLIQWLLSADKDRSPRGLPSFDLAIVLGTLCLPLLSPLVMVLMNIFWGHLFGQPFIDMNIFTDPQRIASTLQSNPVEVARIFLIFFAAIVVSVVIGMLWDRRRWPILAGIFYIIFTLLYTTFFTNGAGFITGELGSMGYWLAQQGVQRGGQPWFYYAILVPLYEFLPLFFSVVGIVYYFVRGIYYFVRGIPKREGNSQAFVPFLIYWVALTIVAYGVAGEKMPWLTVHLALPMIFMAGRFVNDVLEETEWGEVWRQGGAILALFLLLLLAAFVSLARSRPFQGQELSQLSATMQWLAALLVAAALVYGLWRYGLRLGWRHVLRVAFVTLFIVLSLLTVRFAWMLAYINYDYATEYLVYAHATPDVKRVMAEIEEISRRTVGDKEIKVAYDDDSTWPLEWYFREYRNRSFYGANPNKEALDAPLVIVGDKNESKVKPFLGNRYHRFSYRLIWWPIENYKNATLRQIMADLRDPQKMAAFWNIVFYRKYETPTTAWPYVHRFSFYVRKDVASQLWDYGVGPAAPIEMPVDPYARGQRQVASILSWGSQGTALGQFTDPRGLALDNGGRIYVADGNNHRIQVFDSNGQFISQWGSQGAGPGQFQEPWGVAVDQNGNVYVADTWNHRIQKFDSEGEFLLQWGTFGNTEGSVIGQENVLYGPRDIAVDAADDVYVTDTGNKRVMKFSPEGKFLGQWGGFGLQSGQFQEPVGIDIDADGNIYVADTWNRRIQKFDSDFVFLTQWPVHGWESESVINKPYLSVDGDGHVYVTDPEGYRVIEFDAGGTFLTTFGQFGVGDGEFNLPLGIDVDESGNIYVADSANNRVMKFGPLGE